MRLARILVVQVLVAVGPLAGQSRIHTDVDTTLVTVGDRITMTVSVEHASSARVVWPDSLRLAPFEVLETRLLPTETAGEVARSTWVLTLAAFELGELEIPSFDVVVVGPDDAAAVLATDRFGVESVSVGVDETGDIRDIRGPLGLPLSAVRITLWGLLLLVLGGLLYALAMRMRGRGDRSDQPAPGPPPRPAHEVALEALAALEASPMLERGQVKEYHIHVSEILRTYVERRFRVDALEMTTIEVLGGLERSGVDGSFRERLRRFLDQCDLVKFAKVRPGPEASHEVLALGRSLVLDSVPRQSPADGVQPDAPIAEAEVGGAVVAEVT